MTNNRLKTFLLEGSFGDRVVAISFLRRLIDCKQNLLIIARETDRELVYSFVGQRLATDNILFSPTSRTIRCYEKLRRDTSIMDIAWRQTKDSYRGTDLDSCGVLGRLGSGVLPVVAPLSVASYPRLLKLVTLGRMSYARAQRLIMGIDLDTQPATPAASNSNEIDYYCRMLGFDPRKTSAKKALINICTISHKSLSLSQVKIIIRTLRSYGYIPVANRTNMNSSSNMIAELKKMEVELLTVPNNMYIAYVGLFDLLVGAYGGGIMVASAFTDVDIVTWFTPLQIHGSIESAQICLSNPEAVLATDEEDFVKFRRSGRNFSFRALDPEESYADVIVGDDICIYCKDN